MKRLLAALVVFIVLVFLPAPAQADDDCIINFNGNVIVFVCPGGVPSQIPLPTVTVTLPPVTLPPLPPVTITGPAIPGPTQTIHVPGPTATVTEPGGTETIYLPGPTQTVTGPTVTKSPNAGPTVTVSPDAAPTATVTETGYPDGGVDTTGPDSVLFDPPPVTPAAAVGYSVLALLIVAGLIILGLWLGYILGYKDSEREERKFLDALRDQFYTGKHS